jgi:nicotinamidase-related amidase
MAHERSHSQSSRLQNQRSSPDTSSETSNSRVQSNTYISVSQIVGSIEFPELAGYQDDEAVQQFTQPKDLFPDALFGYSGTNKADDSRKEAQARASKTLDAGVHELKAQEEEEAVAAVAEKESMGSQLSKSGSSSFRRAPRMMAKDLTPLSRLLRPGVSRRDDFPLDYRRTALMIIDIQEYLSNTTESYKDDPSKQYLCQEALPRALLNIESLLTKCRALRQHQEENQAGNVEISQSSSKPEITFVYLEALTCDGRDLSTDYKLSGPLLSGLPNPQNPAIFLPSISPNTSRNEIMIPKTSCNVFRSTNIDYVLRNLSVEQVVLCGQVTNQCVESACRDAADLGYFVTVAEDACAAYTFEEHQSGLHNMKGFARIVNTQQVLDELENSWNQTAGEVILNNPSKKEEKEQTL